MTTEQGLLLPSNYLSENVLYLRQTPVLLDFQLAHLYELPTKRINEQVARNMDRFPDDFMFRLTESELISLRSRFATANLEKRRFLPYAFSEHGVLMLSSVLRSPKAIEINIQLVRLFIKLRDTLLGNDELNRLIDDLSQRVDHQDEKLDGLLSYLKRFVETQTTERIGIGYKSY